MEWGRGGSGRGREGKWRISGVGRERRGGG